MPPETTQNCNSLDRNTMCLHIPGMDPGFFDTLVQEGTFDGIAESTELTKSEEGTEGYTLVMKIRSGAEDLLRLLGAIGRVVEGDRGDRGFVASRVRKKVKKLSEVKAA